MAGNENLRSAKRYAVDIPIEYSVGGARKTAQVTNISLGGVYIAALEKFPFGQRVTLKLQISTQKEAIEVGGQVRWVDAGGFGVQFDGLRARDVWALGKYFERLS